MTHDVLATKINPDKVKELLRRNNEIDSEPTIKKARIYDDPGEIVRYQNKLKRQKTNERFNDEYFATFHGGK